MKRKRILILFVALVLGVLAVSILLTPLRRSGSVSAAEDKPKGKLTKVFRREKQNKDEPLPDWVDQAFKKGKSHLKQGGREWSKQLIDVEAELDVEIAEEDDLGETRVRVGQVFNGVPVIGGQLIIHEDANGFRETDGRGFSAARHVDTKPKLKAKDALDAAMKALGYKGKFSNEPQANLVILPNEMIEPKNRIGANLVYVVELLIEDGTEATARHFYYVDANDGSIVWHYDGMEYGTGSSMYNGSVTLPTRQVNGQYLIQDSTRGACPANFDPNLNDSNTPQATRDIISQGGNWTTDANQACDLQGCFFDNPSSQAIGTLFFNANDNWGDGSMYLRDGNGNGTGSTANRQTAAADAHFAAMQVWDYFANTYGRQGIDGAGYRMLTRVHYSRNLSNSEWNGKSAAFGDGNGSSIGPWTSLDTVGHETTHGLFEKALHIYSDSDHPLIYTLETAAFNESFADILGTAVEFYARERQCIPCPANPGPYRTCEQRSGVGSCLLGNYTLFEDQRFGQSVSRDMANPAVVTYNNVDYTAPSGHSNGTLQNKVFWLLAQSGTNSWNGVSVTGIGRAKAENIFYHALTNYLT